MREVRMCNWCDYIHTPDVVAKHEKICKANPVNIAAEARKYWLMKHCKYHDTAFDDGYYEFDCCHKNGNGYGRFADDCNPCEDCAQYCSEVAK